MGLLKEAYKCFKSKYIYIVYRPNKKEKFHKKTLYCPFCKIHHNFIKVSS